MGREIHPGRLRVKSMLTSTTGSTHGMANRMPEASPTPYQVSNLTWQAPLTDHSLFQARHRHSLKFFSSQHSKWTSY